MQAVNTGKHLILASASPRRRELLAACCLDVEVCPADIDETRRAEESPVELVRRLAEEKAHAAYAALDRSLDVPLLAADTIVWDDAGSVLGKPVDKDDARRMLSLLSGATHHVSTGVCLMAPAGGELREVSFVETTDVRFFDLSSDEIAAYVASGEPMDKAGSYGIQGLGRALVRDISGDYANVVGLPVSRVLRELDQLCEGGDFLLSALRGGGA